jgi:hypothetical protein
MKPDGAGPICGTGTILELVTGELSESEAQEIRKHVRGCARCTEELEAATWMRDGIEKMKSAGLPDGVREAAWSALRAEAGKAAKKMRTRSAWRMIFSSRPLLACAGSAAAVLVLVIAFLLFPLVRGRLSQPETVSAGQVLNTIESPRKQALFPCGASVEVKPGTEAVVLESGGGSGKLQLRRGSVEVKVKKLPDRGVFEVVTEDARVVVKGTRFSVVKNAPDLTTVSVMEGKVWVSPAGAGRENIVVSAGQTVDVQGEDAYLDQLKEKGRLAMESGAYEEAASCFEKVLSSSGGDGDTEVELLLAEAAEKNGNYGQAMSLYGKLAKSGNQLRAQNALAFHALLQKKIGKGEEAKNLWKEYLLRFPDGVHAQEALVELAGGECTSDSRPYLDLLMKKYPELKATRDLAKQCIVDAK